MRNNLLITHKKKAVIAGAFIIAFVIICLWSILNKIDTPTPTSSSSPDPNNQSTERLQLVQKIPAEEKIDSPWGVEPVVFIFNQRINPNTISYSIQPSIQSKIKYDPADPNQFSIIPLTGWSIDIKYTITITDLSSASGKNLEEEIKTSVKRSFDPSMYPEVIE